MGVCVSLHTGSSMPRAHSDFLGLTRLDVARLSTVYRSLKKDKNGFVEISTVLRYFGYYGNKFMERAFLLLNRDEEREFPLLNFEEFVYLIWNFSSCDNIAFLAFSIYDTDRQNDLDSDETDEITGDILSGDEGFLSLKNFVPMRFTGINNSFYSQFLKANSQIYDKLIKMQLVLREKTLGTSRWRVISLKRNQMSKSSSFVDLFDVLKALALKTGSKRNFLAISRHFITRHEKQRTRKVAPAISFRSQNAENTANSDMNLAGYSEPMRRFIKDKMSSDVKHTYHPIYSDTNPDFIQHYDYYDKDAEDVALKSLNDDNSVAESSALSEMSRLERKLRRQNSKSSRKSDDSETKSETAGSSFQVRRKKSRVDVIKTIDVAIPSNDDSDEEDIMRDIAEQKFQTCSKPYMEHEPL